MIRNEQNSLVSELQAQGRGARLVMAQGGKTCNCRHEKIAQRDATGRFIIGYSVRMIRCELHRKL